MTTPTIGDRVWYYADHSTTRGMKTNDPNKPFAAMVADVISDRVVNLVVIDHIGRLHAIQSVAVFLGDDEDDKSAASHCEFEPRKETPAPEPAALPAPETLPVSSVSSSSVSAESIPTQ